MPVQQLIGHDNMVAQNMRVILGRGLQMDLFSWLASVML